MIQRDPRRGSHPKRLFAPLGARLIRCVPRQHATLAGVPASELIRDRVDHRMALGAEPLGSQAPAIGEGTLCDIAARLADRYSRWDAQALVVAPLLSGAAVAACTARRARVPMSTSRSAAPAASRCRSSRSRAGCRSRSSTRRPTGGCRQAHDPRRQRHARAQVSKDIGVEMTTRSEAYNRVFSLVGRRRRRPADRYLRGHVRPRLEWTIATQRDHDDDVGVELRAKLQHVVDTPGWVSGDFHVHAAARPTRACRCAIASTSSSRMAST